MKKTWALSFSNSNPLAKNQNYEKYFVIQCDKAIIKAYIVKNTRDGTGCLHELAQERLI